MCHDINEAMIIQEREATEPVASELGSLGKYLGTVFDFCPMPTYRCHCLGRSNNGVAGP